MSSPSRNHNGHASSSRSPLSSSSPHLEEDDDGLEIQRNELLAQEDPLTEDSCLNEG